jgi:PAS domain S-box-containing protein
MPDSRKSPKHPPKLRADAELRLKRGTAPSGVGGGLGKDALAALYRLAITPESAGEGLKLLHELQTHQIELDLLHEQIEANERELARDMARYKAIYDFAPVGYFIVDLHGHLIESNVLGSQWLGFAGDELAGCAFESFLKAESRSLFARLLKILQEGATETSCVLQLEGSKLRPLHVAARLAPAGGTVLMTAFLQDLLLV